MKKWFLALIAVSVVVTGCGGSPTAPTVHIKTQTQAPAPTLPAPTKGGSGGPTAPPEPTGGTEPEVGEVRAMGFLVITRQDTPTEYVWEVDVRDAPSPFHFVSAATHDDSNDYSPTEVGRPPVPFPSGGHSDDYNEGQRNGTNFYKWPKSVVAEGCGKWQLDVAVYFRNEAVARQPFLAPVLTSPAPCRNEPPPPEPPPPPPSPPVVKWQTDVFCGIVATPFEKLTAANIDAYGNIVLGSDGTYDGDEPFGAGVVHKTVCDGVAVKADVNRSEATITASGPVTVSFVAYRKDGIHVLPQVPVDGTIQTVPAGVTVLRVKEVQ